MKQLPILRTGDKVTPGTLAAALDNLRILSNLRVGPGLELTSNSAGVTISLRKQPGKSVPGAKAELAASGITLELHAEWDSGRPYRVGERCVYKPSGAKYSYVYECADASANASDVPGSSSKWTCKTDFKPLWSAATSYAPGTVVMDGSPWQLSLYTCSTAASGAADRPGSGSGKWTKGADVILGTATFPVTDPDNPTTKIQVPFKELYVISSTYDLTTHKLILYLRAKEYDKAGSLTKIYDYKSYLIDQAVTNE